MRLIHSRAFNDHRLHAEGVVTGPSIELRTDANGEVHGLSFDIKPDQFISLQIDFEIEDSTINLPRATVKHLPYFQNLPHRHLTSIGMTGKPVSMVCSEESSAALYILKTLREFSIFLYYMTGGASGQPGCWHGIEGLTFYLSAAAGTPYSWPVCHVNLSKDSYYQCDRATIVHETAHQVMWREVDFSSLGIAYKALTVDLKLTHAHNMISNKVHTLIEGWAEFFECIF